VPALTPAGKAVGANVREGLLKVDVEPTLVEVGQKQEGDSP